MDVDRRTFLKATGSTVGGGMAAVWLGAAAPSWLGAETAFAATGRQTLHLRMTDAEKQMVTHNALNDDATCYFWVYRVVRPTGLPTDVPGPALFARAGDAVTVILDNALDEPHNFAIPAAGIRSPTVRPGRRERFTFRVPKAGTYLYYDNLNPPVNRMMGLHGALVVMPRPSNGTPYSARDVRANPRMRQLFADLGRAPHWPGLAWGEGAPNRGGFPETPPFRQYVWLLHEASPRLFAAVGNARPGRNFSAGAFMDAFIQDRVALNGPGAPPDENRTPQYFTVNGQSGHFSHGSPFITPHLRVGEPCVIRVLNAGLWTHSMHIHANHMYVMAVNNRFRHQPQALPGQVDNHIWIDTFTSQPLDTWDWLNPYMRPPDVPNARGIGLPDRPRLSNAPSFGVYGDGPGNVTPQANRTWPPVQELHMHIPPLGTTAGDGRPMHVPLSPVCFPMHDHSEPSQTAQGGNYNMGLIAGMNFIGDRTVDANGVHHSVRNRSLTFPHAPADAIANRTRSAAGPRPPFTHLHDGNV
jgi:hypothetical protein